MTEELPPAQGRTAAEWQRLLLRTSTLLSIIGLIGCAAALWFNYIGTAFMVAIFLVLPAAALGIVAGWLGGLDEILRKTRR